MIKRLITRILLMFVVVFIVSFIAHLALTYYMMNIGFDVINFSEYLSIALSRYKDFFETCFLHGEWGYTIYGELISETVFPRFGISILLVFMAILIFIPIGIGMGILSAYFEDTLFDRIFSKIFMALGSLPVYLILMFCIAIFGYIIHILPKSWYFVFLGRNTMLEGMIIPMITLCAYPVTVISTTVRAELIETKNQEYYILCKAKGLTKMQIMIRHSLREVMIPLMTVIADLIIFTLSASFIVEVFYHIPGVAELLYNSLISLDPDFATSYLRVDVKTTIIITTYYMFMTMFLLLLKDIATYFMDPRIRNNKIYM